MKRSIIAAVVAAAAALLGSTVAAPGAAAAPGYRSDIMPVTCDLADFDTAEVVSDPKTRELTLVVTGMASASNVTIDLIPVIYIRQPEYWGIQVIGCSSGIGLQVLTPYTAKLDITSTVGTIGIVVVGAHDHLRIPLVNDLVE